MNIATVPLNCIAYNLPLINNIAAIYYPLHHTSNVT